MDLKILKPVIWLVPVLVLVVVGCEKSHNVAQPPEALFSVVPENGNTTTRFKFNSDHSTNPGIIDTMLFFRWDWDNDGVWDTYFSRSRAYDHRFMLPGKYKVVMEVSNKASLRDTIRSEINVIQGYSPPQPHLVISPETGNIRTLFTMDGSGTFDDEDSLSTLLFRWDWEGDGEWDTQFSSEPVVQHMFNSSNFYRVVVRVKDPSGLTANINQPLSVNLENHKLFVDFTWTPVNGNTADIFVFDGSNSFDPDDPYNHFLYRWDFNADGFYETDFSTSPTIEHQFDVEGTIELKLEIKDKWGLTNRKTKELEVTHHNRPPVASFFTGANYGNATTNFFFDATAISDDEDWETQISIRWDFDSDGNWDTEYSKDRTVYHSFGQEGDFKITLEALDSGGLTDTTSLMVYATGGTNPTGLIIDSDTGDTYGTVKIGNQWWMAENLKNKTNRSCYRNTPDNCDTYGGLYTWTSLMAGSINSGARGLCPSGWHIPTQEDWQKLIDYFGAEEARAKLEYGSDTDFRMRYGGQMSNTGVSQFGGQVTNFWTSTPTAGDNAWAYSFQANKDQYWKLTLGRSYKNSVRCIKN